MLQLAQTLTMWYVQESIKEYDAVLVATGCYHEPNLPDLPGIDTYPGDQLHCPTSETIKATRARQC